MPSRWRQRLPPPRRWLGGILLAAVAVIVVQYYKEPGYWLTDRLATAEVVFELASETVPAPHPAAVPGLHAVECVASGRRLLPADMYLEWQAQAPLAGIYTCRFGFERSLEELYAQQRDLFALLPVVGLTAAAATPSRPTGLAAWSTGSTLLGSESAFRVLPNAVTLLLVLLCARAFGFSFRADWRRSMEPRAPDWRTSALLAFPWALGVIDALIRMWQEELPLLLASGLNPGRSPWESAFSAGVAAPVYEELVYRVWMIPFLSRGMNAHLAIAVSSALFSYAHGHSFLYFALSGFAFGYLWHYTRSATWCIIAHALCNMNAFIRPLRDLLG
jgi:membrane protease YdiL (CAAX protease family)